MSRKWVLSAAAGLVATLLRAAPGEINYQGKLAVADGTPVSAPSQSFTVQVYDAISGGSSVFGPETHDVPVMNGVFNLRIGSVVPGLASALRSGGDKWLQVTVGSTLLSPRQKLLSTPYALAVAAGSVDTDALADGAVTDDKMSDVAWGKITGVPAGLGAPSAAEDGTVELPSVSTFNFISPLRVSPAGGRADVSVDASSVTLAGNVFNAPNRLLRLDGSGHVPAAHMGFTAARSTQAVSAGAGLSGGGTLASDITLSLNLGSTNTWTAPQTFAANTFFPGASIMTSSGRLGLGTVSPATKLDLQVFRPADGSIFSAASFVAAGAGTGDTFAVSATAQSAGRNAGLRGVATSGVENIGVAGQVTATLDGSLNYGLHGASFGDISSGEKWGVYGRASQDGGTKVGVGGVAAGTDAADKKGVFGSATTDNGTKYGVHGRAQGAGVNYGIYGEASGGTENWSGYFTDALYVGGQVTIAGGAPGAGKILTSDAQGRASWQDAPAGGDAAVGNEVVGTANATLTRGGAGDAADPYTLALNLGSTNTWTAPQTFGAGVSFPSSSVVTSNGWLGIGTDSPLAPLVVNLQRPFMNNGTTGAAISLQASQAAGNIVGVYSEVDTVFSGSTAHNMGVVGLASRAGQNTGVLGTAFLDITNSTGTGVMGSASGTATGGAKRGVHGLAEGVSGSKTGVLGEARADDGNPKTGVDGVASGDGSVKKGVQGAATGSGTNYGVYGTASGGSENWAGYFEGSVRATAGVRAMEADVSGPVRLEASSPPAPASGKGIVYYDSSSGKLKASENGGGFVDLVRAGACESKDYVAGSHIINLPSACTDNGSCRITVQRRTTGPGAAPPGGGVAVFQFSMGANLGALAPGCGGAMQWVATGVHSSQLGSATPFSATGSSGDASQTTLFQFSSGIAALYDSPPSVCNPPNLYMTASVGMKITFCP